MDSRAANSSGWLQRLGQGLGRDRKKAVLLAVLAVAVVALAVRLVIRRVGPGDAVAATPSARALTESKEAEPVASGTPEPKSGQVQQDAYIGRIEREVTRDLFAIDLGLYPPVEVPQSKRSAAGAAAPRKPARSREEIVRAQAKFLYLQMTIVSDTPTAIINGQVLGVGDTVDVKIDDGKARLRFRVVKITSHACVVAKDGVEVELRMN